MFGHGISNKLRSKRDLHEYLRSSCKNFIINYTDMFLIIVNLHIPEKRLCSLQFLQHIITDKKHCFRRDEIKHRLINNKFLEFAVKNVWPLVKEDSLLDAYMPFEEMNTNKFPDNDFFWGLLFTLRPAWSNQYYDAVLK